MRKSLGQIGEDLALLVDKDQLEKELGDRRERAGSFEGQRRRARVGSRDLESLENEIEQNRARCVRIEKALARIELLENAGTYKAERARIARELSEDGAIEELHMPSTDRGIAELRTEVLARLSRDFEVAQPEERAKIEEFLQLIGKNNLWAVALDFAKPVKKKKGAKPGRRKREDEALLKEIDRKVRSGMTSSEAITAVAKNAPNKAPMVDPASVRSRLSKAYYTRAGSPKRRLREK